MLLILSAFGITTVSSVCGINYSHLSFTGMKTLPSNIAEGLGCSFEGLAHTVEKNLGGNSMRGSSSMWPVQCPGHLVDCCDRRG